MEATQNPVMQQFIARNYIDHKDLKELVKCHHVPQPEKYHGGEDFAWKTVEWDT